MIAGADPRVRTAFRAALRRQPYFGAPPRQPEVLCVEDMTPAIARAEAVLREGLQTPAPPPVIVFDGTRAAGATGTQRVPTLSTAQAERVLRADSILVLDEYSFKYPAGRLDHFLGLFDGPSHPRPTLTRRGIVGRLAVALFAPVILVGVFAAGMGVGHAESAASKPAGRAPDPRSLDELEAQAAPPAPPALPKTRR